MKSNTRKLLKPIFDAVDQIISKDADIQIPEPIHQEYINYHDKISFKKYDYDQVIKNSKELLFDQKTSDEVKKKLLLLLGHYATKECFDILRKYLNNPNSNLKDWATLSIKEIQFKIDNEIYEDGRDIIMSPMGGKGEKLRYYVVIGSKHNKSLDKNVKKDLKKDLSIITSKVNSEIESVKFGRTYILIEILIPINISVGKMIEDFLDITSRKKGILKYHYFVVNTHKITKNEIDEYLKMDEIKKL